MNGGNGKAKILKPGQNVPQGQILGPGGMDARELELRRELEYDYVMSTNLQQAVAMAGDLVKKFQTDAFADSPEGGRQLQEALELHKDLAEMQLRILRVIRRKTKKCEPFSKMKDLKFSQLDGGEEV